LNATRNRIVAVKHRTELLDIAYRAMATDPKNRYATVGDFIAAIKEYQAHAESRVITRRATRDLALGDELRENPEAADAKRRMYEAYARARHGYDNALELWPQNSKAKRRLARARRRHAEAAFTAGDYDLAMTLTDEKSEADTALRMEIAESQRKRDTQAKWFKGLLYTTAASLVAMVLGSAGFSVFLLRAYGNADHAEERQRIAESQLKQVEKDTEQKVQQADARVAKADARAVRVKAEADTVTRAADTTVKKAREQVKDARREVANAATEAERKRVESDLLVQEANEKAEAKSAQAKLSEVRLELFSSGMYAASKMLATVPEEARESEEYPDLLRACDWRKEAAEVAAGRDDLGRLVATSPSGEWVAVAELNAGDATVRLARVGEPLPAGWKVNGELTLIGVSADGSLVSAVVGGGLHVFDAATGGSYSIAEGAPPGRLTSLAFHPQRPELVTGSTSTAVERWSIDPKKRSVTRIATDEGRNHGAQVTAVAYSSEGDAFVSADLKGRVFMSSLNDEVASVPHSHAERATGSPLITAVAFDDKRLAYGCDDGLVHLVDTRRVQAPSDAIPEWEDVVVQTLPGQHAGAVVGVAIDRATGTVVSAGGGTALVRALAGPGDRVEYEPVRQYHDQPLRSLALDAQGHAYSSDKSGRVVRWRIAVERKNTLVETSQAGKPVRPVRVALFNSQDRSTLVADGDGFVTRAQWDGASRSLFAGHRDHARMKAWSVATPAPRLVTVAADGVACVWDGVAEGKLLRTIDLGGRDVVSVTPDGLVVASTSRSGTGAKPSVAFSVDGGRPRPLWPDRARVAATLRISPAGDGRERFAIGLRDGQLSTWEPGATRTPLCRSVVRPHRTPITALAASSDGRVLYAGDKVGVVTVWRLDAGAWKQTAARRY
ncbi:MAG: hypothetical protein ACRCT8_08365, partial [Lacipirellulaceae bacterium]